MTVNKVRHFLVPQNRNTILGTFIILLTAISAPAFGGWDYLSSVRPETLSWDFLYTFNPYPAYWFFYPFAILPPIPGYLLWNLVNAAGLLYALRYWKSNFLAFSLTIASFWIFYGGEYEGFFAGGLVLALAANPWLAGFGLFLLTIKPQVGLLPILYVILQRRDWRLLVLPSAIYLLSFLVYGWWIPEWLEHIRAGYNSNLITTTNISLFPVGMLALLLLLRYRKSLKIWILAGCLAMPYFPVYSLATLFTIEPPVWWLNAGMWLFYLIPRILPGLYGLTTFGFMIAVILLAIEIWKVESARRGSG